MELVKGGPTKTEIAAVALSKLDLSPHQILADIGCGTGSVAITAAGRVKFVHAVDAREEAINASLKNIQAAGLDNIKLIRGEAPAILETLPPLDCAFVGGTRNIEDVLRVLGNKVNGRIVVNAARIKTVSSVIQTMEDMGIFLEAIHVQISKTYRLAGELSFKSLNPVYIIVGDTANMMVRRNADCSL